MKESNRTRSEGVRQRGKKKKKKKKGGKGGQKETQRCRLRRGEIQPQNGKLEGDHLTKRKRRKKGDKGRMCEGVRGRKKTKVRTRGMMCERGRLSMEGKAEPAVGVVLWK